MYTAQNRASMLPNTLVQDKLVMEYKGSDVVVTFLKATCPRKPLILQYVGRLQ